MKHRNLLNLEPTLIFALAKISPWTKLLASQKQAVISLTGRNHINSWWNI
jgi:hypothetical protein